MGPKKADVPDIISENDLFRIVRYFRGICYKIGYNRYSLHILEKLPFTLIYVDTNDYTIQIYNQLKSFDVIKFRTSNDIINHIFYLIYKI